MVVHLLYFAWLRERIGRAEEEVALPPGVESVGALLTWLRRRGSPYDLALAESACIRSAINQDFAAPDARFKAGDEIALFPPITGG
jgi:molybdopterin synthase sulfur carrier subunit